MTNIPKYKFPWHPRNGKKKQRKDIDLDREVDVAWEFWMELVKEKQ